CAAANGRRVTTNMSTLRMPPMLHSGLQPIAEVSHASRCYHDVGARFRRRLRAGRGPWARRWDARHRQQQDRPRLRLRRPQDQDEHDDVLVRRQLRGEREMSYDDARASVPYVAQRLLDPFAMRPILDTHASAAGYGTFSVRHEAPAKTRCVFTHNNEFWERVFLRQLNPPL